MAGVHSKPHPQRREFMAGKQKSIASIVSWSSPHKGSSDLMGSAPGGAGVVDWVMFAILAIGVVTLAVAIASSDYGALWRFWFRD
jgi:hypothetical protein